MSALFLISGGVHQLEGDIAAIVGIVETALAALGVDDPLRADLEEILAAARIAIHKAEALATRATVCPVLRAV